MKDLEENPVTADEGAPNEMKNIHSNRRHQAVLNADENTSNGNGVGEPLTMHDVSKKQYQEHLRRIPSDRDRGHVTSGNCGREDDRFGRSSESLKRPNKAKRNRGWGNERRKPNEKNLSREGRKRKYLEDRSLYSNYLELEGDSSEDGELFAQSASDMSDVSRSPSPQQPSESMRSDSWSWKPRYQDAGYHDERQRKSAKRRPYHRASYEREMPTYNPYIRDTGRYCHMRSPMSLEMRFDELISQMLHRQDSMLLKLDVIVNLLQKTVKVLTSPQNRVQSALSISMDSNSLHDMQSSLRRAGEQFSDLEIEGDYLRPRESKNASYSRYTSSAEKERSSKLTKEDRSLKRFVGSQEAFKEMEPDMIRSANPDGGRVEVRDQVAPRISSYYSVRGRSPEFFHRKQYRGEDKEEEGGDFLRRLNATNENENNSCSKHHGKEKSSYEYGAIIAEAKNNIGREKTVTENNIAAEEKLQLKESTDESPIRPVNERHFFEEGDKIAYVVSTKDKAHTNDIQRSLKMNERPSMVDLSQTSNIIMPQKYYAINTEALSGSGSGVEAVETRDAPLYGDEAIPCVYSGQGWQSASSMDKFSPPSSYRRRDSIEYKTWLARTFTTGSGHSEDFPRSMVTKGHEARSTHHNGTKSSLTDNKKMMSSIAHLVMSSIDVSSEIVQILVATPSDNNSNKEQSRKSMECLLNQSLAVMGCLPLIAEIDLSVVQKIYQSSKNCMSFIYRLMDHCYAREELMRCRVAGGVRRYRGNNTETEQLCPKRLRTVLKLASDLFPNEYIKLSKANMIRNNINMKCRKTVIRDISN